MKSKEPQAEKNSKNKKKKVARSIRVFYFKQEIMADVDNNNNTKDNNKNNVNNGNNDGGTPCHNSPRYLAHIVIQLRNVHQTEMKMGLLKVIYANSFTRLDHEDPYTYLMKFYEILETPGAPKREEETLEEKFFNKQSSGI